MKWESDGRNEEEFEARDRLSERGTTSVDIRVDCKLDSGSTSGIYSSGIYIRGICTSGIYTTGMYTNGIYSRLRTAKLNLILIVKVSS